MRVSVKTNNFPDVEDLPSRVKAVFIEKAIAQYVQTDEAKEIIKIFANKQYLEIAKTLASSSLDSEKKAIHTTKIMANPVEAEVHNFDDDIMGDFNKDDVGR